MSEYNANAIAKVAQATPNALRNLLAAVLPTQAWTDVKRATLSGQPLDWVQKFAEFYASNFLPTWAFISFDGKTGKPISSPLPIPVRFAPTMRYSPVQATQKNYFDGSPLVNYWNTSRNVYGINNELNTFGRTYPDSGRGWVPQIEVEPGSPWTKNVPGALYAVQPVYNLSDTLNQYIGGVIVNFADGSTTQYAQLRATFDVAGNYSGTAYGRTAAAGTYTSALAGAIPGGPFWVTQGVKRDGAMAGHIVQSAGVQDSYDEAAGVGLVWPEVENSVIFGTPWRWSSTFGDYSPGHYNFTGIDGAIFARSSESGAVLQSFIKSRDDNSGMTAPILRLDLDRILDVVEGFSQQQLSQFLQDIEAGYDPGTETDAQIYARYKAPSAWTIYVP